MLGKLDANISGLILETSHMNEFGRWSRMLVMLSVATRVSGAGMFAVSLRRGMHGRGVARRHLTVPTRSGMPGAVGVSHFKRQIVVRLLKRSGGTPGTISMN